VSAESAPRTASSSYPIYEFSDRDSPKPRCRFTLASVAPRTSPHDHEGVLDHLIDHGVIGAPSSEAGREPWSRDVMELTKRLKASLANCCQQVGFSRQDTPIVALTAVIGSYKFRWFRLRGNLRFAARSREAQTQ